MSESDSSVSAETSSSFIQRLDCKIKAYRQELQAVKEYHQSQKESTSDKESDITEISRASPSALLESFEKLTLNERYATPSEVDSEVDPEVDPPMDAGSPLSSPSKQSPTSKANSSPIPVDHLGLSLESGDQEEIDPIYLQPCNEFTDQFINQDEEDTPDDSDSLCNSTQYSEHTHILDVEPPTFSVYGDDSVYEAPISHYGTTRRRSKSLYQGQSNKSFEETRSALRSWEGTIYEDDFLDRSYRSVPPETHGYLGDDSQVDDYHSERSNMKHWSPFVDRETNGSGPYQDEFDSISSRRSPSPYGIIPEDRNNVSQDYLTKSPYRNLTNTSSHDDLSLLRAHSTRVERGKIDFGSNKPSYSRDAQKESYTPKSERVLSDQPYTLRDDISSKEGSIDTPTRYSARNEDYAPVSRSLADTPSPSSPNLRRQLNRSSLLDRYDNDLLRRSRSNLSDFIPNATRSSMGGSPRSNRYYTSPRFSDTRRVSQASLSSAGSLHATRSLISDRPRRNRYTIPNVGDTRNDLRETRSESRSSHILDHPLSDTTSDFRPRKLNEVKFEIFRAVHRVKMALESLAEKPRAYPVLSDIQGIQDLNEQALQTMIEQFEHIHEMFGESDGSVGYRRPISPLSDESYGKLLTKDTVYGTSDDIGSRYTRSEISSPSLYSRRGQNSRLDRSSCTEPPLSPSPSSRISRWQNLIDDSKASGLIGSKLRGASVFEA